MKKNHNFKNVNRKNAFTLVELLITIGILVIIAGIAVPQVVNYINRSKCARAQMDMSTISTAVKCFYTDWGQYPESLDELKGTATGEDVENTSSNYTVSGLKGGIDYFGSIIPQDIFNNSELENTYKYASDPSGSDWYILWSLGINKTDDFGDIGDLAYDSTTDEIKITSCPADYDDIYESNKVVVVEVNATP
jgi:prepilin-type N-terminal cleavage/methylation domain-containing protein